MTTFTSGAEGVRVIGVTASRTGNTVSMIGDYNNDGLQDFAVSASNFTVGLRHGCGLVIIVLGQTGSWTEIDLETATSSLTMRRIIGGRNNDNAGTAVGPAGDVNQDGISDMLVGAGGVDLPTNLNIKNVGAVYVIFGTASSSAYTDIDLGAFVASATTGYAIYGPVAGTFLGNGILNIRSFGDMNGDSIDDIAISAPNAVSNTGYVWFIYGYTTTPADLYLSSLGSVGVQLTGAGTNYLFGYAMDNVGDFDGDGKNDTAIGAYGYDSSRGMTYLIYGTGAPTNLAMASFTTGNAGIRFLGVSGSLVAGSEGFNIVGVAASHYIGWSVSRGGDVDQDGLDDFLIGTGFNLGRMYVLYGSLTTPTAHININTYTGGPQRLDVGAAYLLIGPIHSFTDAPTKSPSQNPTAAPSDPSTAPSENPSQNPSMVPSEVPSEMPTLMPSADPTVTPSEVPSEMPTFMPSADPSMTPSAAPSEIPSFAPSEVPSEKPSLMPSADPSMSPSEVPSAMPTLMPSQDPTITPSEVPSELPTLMPSVNPTITPSAAPSVDPTLAPTASPSRTPTMQPSALPTARPTDKPYEVVLAVQQDVYFVSKTDYDSQKVQCNLTIQHTVAASMDGVVPERVTEIEVEETEAARFGNMRALATSVTPPVSLKYKVTVYDPVLSAEVLTAQLKAKVLSGDMDNAFRAFAVMFNATKMQNGTFTEPQVSFLNQQGSINDPPTSGETAGLVLGGFLFLVLLTVGVWLFVRWLKAGEEQEAEQNSLPSAVA
eukprot:gene10195-11933_t